MVLIEMERIPKEEVLGFVYLSHSDEGFKMRFQLRLWFQS